MSVQEDANAQKIAQDNSELTEIISDLQEKVTSLEKENLSGEMKTFRKVKSYAAFTLISLIMGLSKPCLII